jgi:Bacterial Ig-like domain (group 3)
MTLFSARRTRVFLCLVATAVACWLFAGVAQAALTGTAPTISGNAQQGQTLTVTQGKWTDDTTATITGITDAWESCTVGAGATCSAVGSGTTYTVAATDIGNTIQVVETATTDTDGSAMMTSAPTAQVTALPPAPPVNTSPPTIAGTAQQGKVLTMTQGQWTGATTITDQWELCTPTCSAISGSIGTTYTPTAADVGHTVEVVETATNTGGSTTITIGPTVAVTALPPANTSAPTIAGTAQIGQVLTLTQGIWTNSPTVTDQWEQCTGATCSAIAGQTGTTYTVTAADVGKTIRVLETATNSGGSSPVPSNATSPIVAPPTANSAPSISGTSQQGSLLTENHASWTGSPTSFGYQWYRCVNSSCTAIPGATSQTYTPTAADVGAAILVAETASNAGGPGAPANSALTAPITTPAGVVPVPASSSPPTVSGTPQQGQPLREGHGNWSNNPSSFGYQWESCSFFGCATIPGATGQTYTLTAGDVGQSIFVVETASNSGGAAHAASARTGTVTATSAISLAASSSGPLTNQTVTLVATISSSSGNVDPAGSLTFFNGGNAIGGCANQSFKSTSPSISLICQASFPAGTARLAAVYTPNAGLPVAASASSTVMLNVGRDSTSTSLAITKRIARLKRATYTATVLLPVSNSGPIHPTGSIQFLDRGRPIRGCGNRPLNKLAATCAIKYRSLGTHRISARYSGDSNFAQSTSPTRSAQIVKHSSGPGTLGFISSTLEWQFQYHPAYTLVKALRADGVVKGTTVLVACAGKGCAFSRRSIQVKTATPIDLLPAFHKRHLRVGSQITLRIMRPHWVGKYYSFTMRAGRGPLIVLSCLGVGRSRPGLGC